MDGRRGNIREVWPTAYYHPRGFKHICDPNPIAKLARSRGIDNEDFIEAHFIYALWAYDQVEEEHRKMVGSKATKHAKSVGDKDDGEYIPKEQRKHLTVMYAKERKQIDKVYGNLNSTQALKPMNYGIRIDQPSKTEGNELVNHAIKSREAFLLDEIDIRAAQRAGKVAFFENLFKQASSWSTKITIREKISEIPPPGDFSYLRKRIQVFEAAQLENNRADEG
jgi:hypothetical protein